MAEAWYAMQLYYSMRDVNGRLAGREGAKRFVWGTV